MLKAADLKLYDLIYNLEDKQMYIIVSIPRIEKEATKFTLVNLATGSYLCQPQPTLCELMLRVYAYETQLYKCINNGILGTSDDTGLLYNEVYYKLEPIEQIFTGKKARMTAVQKGKTEWNGQCKIKWEICFDGHVIGYSDTRPICLDEINKALAEGCIDG